MSEWPPLNQPVPVPAAAPPAGRLPWDQPVAPVMPPEPPKKKRQSKPAALLLVVALLASSLGAAGTYAALKDRVPGAAAVAAPSAVRIGTPETRLPDVSQAAEAVASALLPSIVRVETQTATTSGVGSGVIYSSDGYIVTNDHVVDGASTVSVTLNTGEVVQGRVVGTAAPQVDIAVVKIDKKGLKAAKFGSTHGLTVGELAVAIGNPLGLEASVSAGVVSGLHRNGNVGGERLIDAIQTDAPLHPGNSGGALANAEAEVIGINTLVIVDRAQSSTPVGLAISADTVKNVVQQIIAGGTARIPFIGISGKDSLDGMGADVLSLSPGGPAESAGLQPGDTIRAIDGQSINSMDALVTALISKHVGDSVALKVERNGASQTVTVKLQARQG